MSLYDFAMEYGTDKSSHGYCPLYEQLLSSYIEKECTLMEMGIGGGGSLKMWRRWLPKSKVIGFERDENTCQRAIEASNDYEVVQGDQSCLEDLRKVAKGRFFDIIVDDAGHNANEQLVAFHYLFDHVYPGGWYIIEDIDVDNSQDNVTLEVTRPISIVSVIQAESKFREVHIYSEHRGSCILFLRKR